jgi:hypothetical protein
MPVAPGLRSCGRGAVVSVLVVSGMREVRGATAMGAERRRRGLAGVPAVVGVSVVGVPVVPCVHDDRRQSKDRPGPKIAAIKSRRWSR